ncbi:hypothetical protein MUO71_00670 [Candidatus Bathyarchaeota archaeon]|nr:hypothetical protein [Candidatus Bathyarchaeota archaeon]
MNKIVVYTVVAILLGTVTMVAPLALLGPDDSIPAGQYTIKTTDTGDDNQNRSIEGGGPFDSTDMWLRPEVPDQPLEPAATELATGNASGLTSIGLMTVPSFLVALGVFVYLRKRMS